MAVNRTLLELQDAIRTEMQLDPGLISDVERLQFINDCIIDLGGMSCFEKEVDLEFTEGFANVPEDFVDFIGLYRNGVLVPPITIQKDTTGFLAKFPQIEVRPHATETLSLWYTYAPAKLSLPTDVPDIPYGFDVAIVDYAVGRAHRKNGNIGLYREYMSAYESKKFELYQRLTRFENSRVGQIINSEDGGEDSPVMESVLIFK